MFSKCNYHIIDWKFIIRDSTVVLQRKPIAFLIVLLLGKWIWHINNYHKCQIFYEGLQSQVLHGLNPLVSYFRFRYSITWADDTPQLHYNAVLYNTVSVWLQIIFSSILCVKMSADACKLWNSYSLCIS